MPSRADQSKVPVPGSARKVRKRLAYEAARRREAVTVLQIAECTCRYGASVLANGAGPAEARAAAMECAAELVTVAGALRRLTRPDLDAAQRRALAVRLASDGLSQREIARQVGRSERQVWSYLHGRA